MSKKLLAAAAALIMVMGAYVCPMTAVLDTFTVTASADAVKNDGTFNYQVVNGTVQIVGLADAKKAEISIPAKIEGMPVTEIGNAAFYNKDHEKSNYLKSVTLPDSIVKIDDSAFAYNEVLAEIKIPKSVKTIGASAFEGCVGLKKAELSEGLDVIGDKAFYWCENLPMIKIPSSVTNIGESAFYNCATQLDGSNFFIKCYSNTPGEFYAFDNHIGYELIDPDKSATLAHKGVYKKTFRYEMVNNDTEILVTKGRLEDETIEIPDNIGGVPVTEIKEAAFYNKDHETKNNVKKIKLPSSLKVIGISAFACNEALTDINISKSVKSIGTNAFEDCKSLKKITLPEGLQTIGDQAFTWCTALTSINIPASVTKIGDKAFYNCGMDLGEGKFVINCTEGTAGEKYAKEHGFKYKAAAAPYTKGDANSDKDINVTDIGVMASHIKGIKPLKGSGLKAADVNSDGNINVTDISMVASHIKGIKALS